MDGVSVANAPGRGSPASVLAGCFIGLAVATPAVFAQTFGLYVPGMANESGWSYAQVALAFSIASLVSAGFVLGVGHWIDRSGARPPILLGTLVFPLTLFAWAVMPLSPLAWAGIGILLGLCLALVSGATYLTLPVQWFDKSLGKATAGAALGGSLGMVVWPVVTRQLLEAHDWRQAVTIVAAIVAVIGLANAWLLIHDNPSWKKTKDDAERALATPDTGASATADPDVRAVLKDWRFYAFCFAFFTVVLVATAYGVNMIAILVEAGHSARSATFGPLIAGIAALAGRLTCGVMLDHFSFRATGLLFIGGQMLGGLLIALWPSEMAAFVAIAAIGAAIGAESDIVPVVIRHFFGARSFGRVYAIAFAIFLLGSAAGPLIGGFSIDLYGGFRPAAMTLVAVGLLALSGFVLAAGNARRNQTAHGPA